MKRHIVKDERGLPMRVIRPSDPILCLRIAEECHAKNDSARLDNLPKEAEAAGVFVHELYDERDPQRPQRKRDAAKERERAKAARQARKKNRRRGVR